MEDEDETILHADNKGEDNKVTTETFTKPVTKPIPLYTTAEEQKYYRTYHDQPIEFKYDGFSDYINDVSDTFTEDRRAAEFNLANASACSFL